MERNYDYDNHFYQDYLMHYGVKGMKWGHRRNALSVKAAGHRFSAKTMGVYERMNQGLANRTNKSQFKTSASAFRTVKNDQLKKAEAAQAEANAKRDQRNTPEAKAARRKTALKVGATAAGTALAAYGAYKLHERHKQADVGRDYMNKYASDQRKLTRTMVKATSNKARSDRAMFNKAVRDISKTNRRVFK